MFIVWHRLFSLVLMFSGLRIEALPPSTVQGKCIYTFLKWRTSRLNFRSYVLNLVKINISFFFQLLIIPGSIYRPPVPSEHYQFGRFIGQVYQNSQIKQADLSAERACQTRFLNDLLNNCSQKGYNFCVHCLATNSVC